MNTNSSLPGLYIHVPFCEGKCPYCDFYSTDDSTLIPAWIKALEKEIHFYKETLNNFDTLYLGGGTPSLLSNDDLEKLRNNIHKYFSFVPDSEITIEANPGDLNPDKLKQFKALGFNRISLGVQSFDDTVLRFLNRRHTAKQAEKAVADIRNAGFENLSIDLMYSVPGQGKNEWIKTLEKALSFSPEHFSCYQLTIKEGTPFFVLKENGEFKVPVGEEESFLLTSDILEENGYIHYEVSNFAKSANLFSSHNQKYWQHIPYLGLGPSAHSFMDDTRWWNVSSVKEYINVLNKGSRPIEEKEKIGKKEKKLESLFLGFRTKQGIALGALKEYKKVEIVLNRLIESGLIEMQGDRAVPTKKGFLVADRLPLMFD
jgi:oxygen-independent coproporphyrinogen-3 oxidase